MKLKEKLLKIKAVLTLSQQETSLPMEPISVCTNEEEINRILEKAIEEFFPKNGVWIYSCFSRSNQYDIHNLPCHLRDNDWLANMLQINQNLHNISIANIKSFISSSPHFTELRHNYELEIVKWQIEWMMNDGQAWLVDDNLGGDFSLLMPMCDIAFRKGVVDTLRAIGMDEEVIEEGIEKNTNLWLDKFITKAFYYQFNEPFNFYYISLADNEYQAAWIKMRKYEYYQAHKVSVNKYGKVIPDMLLSEEELKQLHLFLIQKRGEKLIEIEKFKLEHASDSQKVLIM